MSRKNKNFLGAFIATFTTGLILSAIIMLLPGHLANSAVTYPPGAMLQPNDITSSHIRDGVILNIDVSSTAAIAWSKIDASSTITNANVSSTAAIAATKISTSTENFFITDLAQTLAGIKTFSSIPVLPASDPTSDNQAARKLHIDTLILNLKSTSMTAYTDIAAGNFVGVGDGSTIIPYLNSGAVGLTQQQFGRAADEEIENTFTVTHPFPVKSLRVRISKQATPVDSAQVGIRTSEGGAYLATGSIAAASLTTSAAYYTIELDSIVNLNTTSTYRIVHDRTGALDATNYYNAWFTTGNPYTGGTMRVLQSSVWNSFPDVDLDFILGITPTAGQLFPASAASSTTVFNVIGGVNSAISAGSTGQAIDRKS